METSSNKVIELLEELEFHLPETVVNTSSASLNGDNIELF